MIKRAIVNNDMKNSNNDKSEIEYTIRAMEPGDYEQVKALWLSIDGFCIRSLDDSEEGVLKFLARNPGLSCVCEVEETGSGAAAGEAGSGAAAGEAAGEAGSGAAAGEAGSGAAAEATGEAGGSMDERGFKRRHIVGTILCGHDGRRGCLYHVCVAKEYRMHGIGKSMVNHCMEGLHKEGINKVSLIAFTRNDVGNAFWHEIGWTKREDLNYYDFVLNQANIFTFNKNGK